MKANKQWYLRQPESRPVGWEWGRQSAILAIPEQCCQIQGYPKRPSPEEKTEDGIEFGLRRRLSYLTEELAKIGLGVTGIGPSLVSQEVKGLSPGKNFVAHYLNLRKRARGEISWQKLAERLGLKITDNKSYAYIGFAVKTCP